MASLLKLSTIFLKHASVRVVMPEDAEEGEELLRRAWRVGHDKWPEVAVPDEDFVCHLAGRLTRKFESHPLAEVLGQILLADLYLACACVRGVPAAIEVLERDYLAKLTPALQRQKLSAAEADEICQTVRIQLLLGATEGKPLLAGYQGLGKMESWIWVIAMKLASRSVARLREVQDEEGVLEAFASPGDSPEIELLKRRYRADFHQAMREAIEALTRQQRYLLRLHHIDRLPTTRIAPLFDKNQSTISRWLTEAREEVYEGTKRRLQQRLNLSSEGFESLMSAIRSRFDMSLSQVLNESGGDEESEEVR